MNEREWRSFTKILLQLYPGISDMCWWILKKGVWSVEPSWKSFVWQKQPQITHIMEFETVDKAWKKWNRPEILLSESGLRSELVWLCVRGGGGREREQQRTHTVGIHTSESAARWGAGASINWLSANSLGVRTSADYSHGTADPTKQLTPTDRGEAPNYR